MIWDISWVTWVIVIPYNCCKFMIFKSFLNSSVFLSTPACQFFPSLPLPHKDLLTLQHREVYSILCNGLKGKESKKEHIYVYALEKEMAAHSSITAWKTPWTEEPGGLQSTGSHRVGHDWASNAHAMYIYNWFTLVHLKLMQHCKSTVFRYKIFKTQIFNYT